MKTFHGYKNGNGAWQFGLVVWFNSQRAGLEFHFAAWTVTWLRERGW